LKNAELNERAASGKGEEIKMQSLFVVFPSYCTEYCRLEVSDRSKSSFRWRGNMQKVILRDRRSIKHVCGLERPIRRSILLADYEEKYLPAHQRFEHFR